MRIDAALLCDAATVREGLLHVLGAGVTRLYRSKLPAPLNVMFAVLIDVAPGEADTPHEVELRFTGPQNQMLGIVKGAFKAARSDRCERDEHQLLPVVLDLRNAGATAYGGHLAKLRLDGGVDERQVEFWVQHPDEKMLPPVQLPS